MRISSLTKQQEDEIASFSQTFPGEWLQFKNHSKHRLFDVQILQTVQRWDKHRLAVTSRQERHRDMCVDEFKQEQSHHRGEAAPNSRFSKAEQAKQRSSCTELYTVVLYLYLMLYCTALEYLEIIEYLASMASMASGCASRSAWHRGLKELAEDKIQDLQTRMRARKNLSQNL